MSFTLMGILSTLMTIQVMTTLGTVCGLVMADFVLGVLASFRSGTFKLSKLAQFMETGLVPYVGGLLVLALLSSANVTLATLFFTIAATVSAKFLADITAKVSQLFNGVQIQSPITVSSTSTTAPAKEAPVAPPAG
jgi:hypothetical protein